MGFVSERPRPWDDKLTFGSALSSDLSRPLIINHADGKVEMPKLVSENNTGPVLFRHIELYYRLCVGMANAATHLGGPAGSDAEKANRMQDVVERWFANLPAEYALKNPDTCWDDEYEWVVFQRRYLHFIGHMSLFNQLEPFIAQSSANPMSNLESTLRTAALQAKAHIDPWMLFENPATLMRFTNEEDEARNPPQRVTVLDAIKEGLSILQRVNPSRKKATQRRFLDWILAHSPPPPPPLPCARLPDPPTWIIDRFVNFMLSVLADLDERDARDFDALL